MYVSVVVITNNAVLIFLALKKHLYSNILLINIAQGNNLYYTEKNQNEI